MPSSPIQIEPSGAVSEMPPAMASTTVLEMIRISREPVADDVGGGGERGVAKTAPESGAEVPATPGESPRLADRGEARDRRWSRPIERSTTRSSPARA